MDGLGGCHGGHVFQPDEACVFGIDFCGPVGLWCADVFVAAFLQGGYFGWGEVFVFFYFGDCGDGGYWAGGLFEVEAVTLLYSAKGGVSGFGEAQFDGFAACDDSGEIGPF